MNNRTWLHAAIGLATLLPAFGEAQVRTDGSLGPAQAIAGPNFVIPQSLGRQAGSNLFFSFRNFSIGSGQSATFITTTPNLANVVSRVTGGNVSVIDGPLRLQSAGATPAFIFINPAGVVFGAGASIDVPGAFHVATADYLRFADGRFYADPASGSTLSSASPEAFGFLGTTRSTLVLSNGANLATRPYQAFSLTAGDIQMSNARATAPNGEIRVAAVGDRQQQVPLSGPLPDTYGNLTLLDFARIDSPAVGEHDGGTVRVSAGDITIAGLGGDLNSPTGIFSNAAYGTSANSGDIFVNATGRILIGPSGQISASADSYGRAGRVSINADSITIDAGGYCGILSEDRTVDGGSGGNVDIHVRNALTIASGEITADGHNGTVRVDAGDINIGFMASIGAQPTGNGSAGSVDVTARRNLTIDGGMITSTTFDDTKGGDVTVAVGGDIALLNGGTIQSSTAAGRGSAGTVRVSAGNIRIDGDGSGIRSDTDCCGTGNAGAVFVDARGGITISDGGVISSTTTSDGYRRAGTAGSVHVAAASLTIDGAGKDALTGISSSSLDFGGDAGSVDVAVSGRLAIVNGGQISSATRSAGNAGNIRINAGSLLVDSSGEADINHPSQVTTTALLGSTGNAGNIDITVGSHLELLHGGVIGSNAAGQQFAGSAGSINVSAGDITIDSFDSPIYSGISALAGPHTSGQTGSITVTARDFISIANHGYLDIENFAHVDDPHAIAATRLSVRTPVLRMASNAFITASSWANVPASNIQVDFGSLLFARDSSITTTAHDGNGGFIRIRGDGALVLRNADIVTSVLGSAGNGGDIDVNARALVLDSGFIQANTAAEQASGGNVTVDVQALVPSGRSLFVGGKNPFDFKPVYGFNVIQAAAPTGVSGVIDIASPVLDIASSITALATYVIDTGGLARSPCGSSGGSVLAQTGRGGLAPSARGLLRAERSFTEPRAQRRLPSELAVASMPCR